jgi:hypothetical protein
VIVDAGPHDVAVEADVRRRIDGIYSKAVRQHPPALNWEIPVTVVGRALAVRGALLSNALDVFAGIAQGAKYRAIRQRDRIIDQDITRWSSGFFGDSVLEKTLFGSFFIGNVAGRMSRLRLSRDR